MDDSQRLKRNSYMRKWKRENKKKVNATNKKWKDEHREQVRESSREYARQYRIDNPEKTKESLKQYRIKNRDKVLARTKEWFKAHPEYNRIKLAEHGKKDPVRRMLHGLKARAKKNGMKFSLSREDITIPDICPVLGIRLVKGSGGFLANSPSVDRMDNNQGYVPGNVQVVSLRANLLKRDGTLDEFRKIVAYMERG